MTETHHLVSGADPEVALYDGIAFYESGEIYNALTCWRELLKLVPEHEVAQRYLEFVQGYLGLSEHFNEEEVNTAQRREGIKLKGDQATVAQSTAGFNPAEVSSVPGMAAVSSPQPPPPPESIRIRRGASATGTHLAAGLIVDAENAEDLIEEEVITKKPDEGLPVTLLANPEQMAFSETAKKAITGDGGPRTQADGLSIQALSRQLADFHRSGKYEEAVDTAKNLLMQDPQHAVARRYIDEYHRQKQAALQTAIRKQKAAQKVETRVQKPASFNATQLSTPKAAPISLDPENAPTAAPANNQVNDESMNQSVIKDLSHRPKVKMKSDQISWQAFDHRAGFFMSQVDGNTSYEDLVVISAMPRDQALNILNQLVSNGVIG